MLVIGYQGKNDLVLGPSPPNHAKNSLKILAMTVPIRWSSLMTK